MVSLTPPPHRHLPVRDAAERQAAHRELALLASHLDWAPPARERLDAAFGQLESRLWQGEPLLLYRLLGHPASGLELIAATRGAAHLDEPFRLHHTRAGWTVAVACLHDRRPPAEPDVGGVSVSLDGGPRCGDGWAFRRDGDDLALLVVDGLGHGPKAAEARDRALDLFDRAFDGDLERFVERANDALRATRGAAVGLLAAHDGVLEYVGLGNIGGWLRHEGDVQRLVSLPGTLGLKVVRPRTRRFEHPWTRGCTAILCSDGLQGELPADPDLWTRDPALVAASLFVDLATGRDDAAVAVVRCS